MAHFIKCSETEIEIKTSQNNTQIYVNHPINIERIDYISKEFYNNTHQDIYKIEFSRIGLSWFYNNEEDRNKDYNKIINNEF